MIGSEAQAVRKAKYRKGRRAGWSPLRTGVVLLIAVTYLYPFIFMIATALKPADQYIRSPAGWPTSLTLDHLRDVWSVTNPNLGEAMKNSAIAVSIGVGVCLVITSLAAFYFVRRRNRLTNALLAVFGSLWLIPIVVWLVPFFTILSRLDLIDNLVVLGVVYGAVFAPGFLWLLWAYFLQAIPKELTEAAEV